MKYLIIAVLLFICLPPASTQADAIDNPIKNFEALWSTFDQRYVNFDLKGVDWDQVYQQYRPQVSPQTTNLELYEICCAMVQELNDGHVTLEPNFKDSDVECGAPYPFLLEELFATVADRNSFYSSMEATFNDNGFSKAIAIDITEETNFQYRTSSQYGYLRFDEMTEQLNLKPLDRALDQALTAFQDKEGVIIDLRFNGGGWDYAGYKVANRFVKEKRLGHSKKQRKKGTDTFGKLKSFYVEPQGDYQFTKPIIILTSDVTASASEVFLLALKDLPYVTIVGNTTEGIFSDMYEFSLPNKWDASLSHQRFYDANMVNYEGEGITPDHMALNSREEMERGMDGVIEKALELLTSPNE